MKEFEWLVSVPASDLNFKGALARADAATVRAALEQVRANASPKGNKGKLAAMERRLREMGEAG
jgi:hypothetical protein